MLTDRQFAKLKEIVRDAVPYRDLTPWEQTFVRDFAGKIARYGASMTITDKQQEAIDRIERKIYRVG